MSTIKTGFLYRGKNRVQGAPKWALEAPKKADLRALADAAVLNAPIKVEAEISERENFSKARGRNKRSRAMSVGRLHQLRSDHRRHHGIK